MELIVASQGGGEYRRKSRRFRSIREQNDLAVSARTECSGRAESSIVVSV